jgi:hypothetical protein
MSVTLPSEQDCCNTGIWNQVLAHVAKEVQPDCFQTWFRPIVFAGHDATAFRLSVPNDHFRRCLLENYADMLHKTVGKVTGGSVAVEISVATSPEGESSTIGASGSNGLPPLPVIRAAALQSASKLQNWLIEGLWMTQAVGILGGAPKCGKTWMALDMAVSVASGSLCLGAFAVHSPGPVLLYAAEDSSTALRARIESLARTRGLDFDNLDVRVIAADSLRLDLPADQSRLEATVMLHRPVLLVLDPLVRIHMADENVSGQMAALLGYFRSLQRKTGVAIALVHHARKNVSPGAGAGYSLRGSSDLYAFIDSFLYMRKNRDQLTLSAEHRAAPGLGPLALELVSSSSADATMYLKLASSEAQMGCVAPADPLQSRILQLLSGATEPLTVDTLRSQLQVRNQRVVEALRQLSSQGKVERLPHGYAIKT